MIQEGDRFNCNDLRQSVRELCDYNLQHCFKKNQPNIGMVIGGDSMITPSKCTPDEYAETCAKLYGEPESSAISLDHQLREKGYRTSCRFSCKYNIAGMTHQQIIHDAYRLDWFLQVSNTVMPAKEYLEKYETALNDAFRVTYYYAQYLWAINPRTMGAIAQKLRMPEGEQWPQLISAILGVGFQFHPADVYEHAIKHVSPNTTRKQFNERYAEQLKFKNEMKKDYGIDTGCLVLSPENREKLRKIVTGTDTPRYMQVIKKLLRMHAR